MYVCMDQERERERGEGKQGRGRLGKQTAITQKLPREGSDVRL